jgi:hypothetical protein
VGVDKRDARDGRRAAATARATEIAAAAQQRLVRAGHAQCTYRAIARAWKLRDHKGVAARFDAATGKALTLGEPLALPRELAREIYVGLLAELEAGAPDAARADVRDTCARLVIQLGRAHEALLADLADDGAIHAHAQHAASFLQIAALAMRGYLAAQRAADGARA